MDQLFNRIPHKVPLVNTKYRRIETELPPTESLPILDKLAECEPISMTGQPPLIWDRAKGFNVFDAYGNMWLDFTSGVVVANCGHSNDQVLEAIKKQVNKEMLHSYCFPNVPRCELVSLISEIAPYPLKKVFLLCTGSETAECAIKLSRTYGKTKRKDKIQIITFDDAFHGRTLGSLQAGGSNSAKTWVTNLDPDVIQVPFPNAFKYSWADESNPEYSEEKCFSLFLEYLDQRGAKTECIAAFLGETFQGGWVQLMPKGFVKRLREFCDKHDILLVFDEIQAGFGRTGKLFGFQHYDVVPDLMLLGKGISSSLPVSAIVGREDVLNLYGPNQMTSTHTGNPITNAAAVANIHFLLENDLPKRVLDLGERIVRPRLQELKKKYSKQIGIVNGSGMIWGVIFVDSESKQHLQELAHDVVQNAYEMGLLLFAPVGGGGTIKICPPLIISEDALLEGIQVLDAAIEKALLKIK